jgi:hypothetical protein
MRSCACVCVCVCYTLLDDADDDDDDYTLHYIYTINYTYTVPFKLYSAIGETCREYCNVMNAQLDLRLEAENLSSFAAKFVDDPWVAFPTPIEGFVKHNVLIETLMEGSSIVNFMKMQVTSLSLSLSLSPPLSLSLAPSLSLSLSLSHTLSLSHSHSLSLSLRLSRSQTKLLN